MFTRMTGDLVKAMRGIARSPSSPPIDGVCAGAGAIVAMASDIRLRHGTQQDRLPVQSRRPGGMRHGGLRDPAAASIGHGPCERSCSSPRPFAGRRGSRALGLLQPARCDPKLICWPQARAMAVRPGRTGRPSPTASPRPCCIRNGTMGIDQAIESEAQAQAICMLTRGLHAAPTEAFVGKAAAGVRGQLKGPARMSDTRLPGLAVLRGPASHAGA